MPARIVAKTNIITGQRYSTTIPSGKTLHDSINLPDDILIGYNGEPYNNEILQDGDLINLVVVPKGGETGKDFARTGIILAAQIGAGALFPGSALGMVALRAGFSAGAWLGANALVPAEGKK